MSSSPRDVVGFVFAIVRRRVQTGEELQRVPEIVVQTATLRSAHNRLGWNLVGLRAATTTYRSKCFIDEPSFKETVSDAQAKGAILLIGDIFGSLRNVDAKAAARCFDVLDRAGVEIVNAFDSRPWASFTPSERQHRHFVATRSTVQRSQAIKKALSDRQAAPGVELAARQKLGAAAGARHADDRARALADVVQEIADRNSGGPTPDAQLARELNDLGMDTARGKKWMPMTAKRLRQRLRGLGLIKDDI